MKFILKSFVFVGIFAMVFLNTGSQNAFAATTNNCLAQYISPGGLQGVRFSLPILSGELQEDSFVSIRYGLTQSMSNSQSADFIPSIANAPDYFQYEDWGMGSPSDIYYQFMLNNQQYCPPPPIGFKTLTTSTTSNPAGGAGAGGAGVTPGNANQTTGAGTNPQSCPTGETWNTALNQCAPTAQTVGGNQTGATSGGNQTGATSGGNQTGATSGGQDQPTENPRLINPLGGVDSIEGFLEKLFNIVLRIAIPIIALAIIYSGFLFVTAQGREAELTTAKRTLMYTLIGAAIILASWVIASALKSTVDDIRNDAGVQQNVNTNG